MIYKVYNGVPTDLESAFSNIADTCIKHDNLNHSFFVEDEPDLLCGRPCAYYYKTDDGKIIGFVSFFAISEESVECCCFVLPEFRKQGIFSRLFTEVLEDYEDTLISVAVAKGNTVASNILEDYDAVCNSCECKMSLSINNYSPRDVSFHNTNQLFPKDFAELSLSEVFLGSGMYQYVILFADISVGSCFITIEDDCATISNVEIKEEYRGHGLGTPLINLILNKLYFANLKKVILHVTKQNVPAYRLYISAGFSPDAEYFYYCL